MTNLEVAKALIGHLVAQGVREVCLCTGARNAPLVEALTEEPRISITTFFDERTAAFFALGRARKTKSPVVVCTTSGTAVAELLPATIESRYVGAPLVLLTADRPKQFRHTGAPQTIDQVSFLRPEVALQWDLETWPQVVELHSFPVHINVCFEEPVLSAQFGEVERGSSAPDFSQVRRPLAIVGALSETEHSVVCEFLNKHDLYFIPEAHSGLRGHPQLKSRRQLNAWVVGASQFTEHFDGVIRIGGVPTARLWRDLDYDLNATPVLSFSGEPWSGRGRDLEPAQPIQKLKTWQRSFEVVVAPQLEEQMLHLEQQCEDLMQRRPESELALVRALSSVIRPKSSVFIGNSLPIREWDLVAKLRSDLQIFSQRGVNGIDGLLSTFLGMLDPKADNVLVVGDLSAFYDSNVFWLVPQLPSDIQFKIVVINNRGGRIFRRMFANTTLQLEHSYDFRAYAQLWSLPYARVMSADGLAQMWLGLAERALLELAPDASSSDLAWNDFDA